MVEVQACQVYRHGRVVLLHRKAARKCATDVLLGVKSQEGAVCHEGLLVGEADGGGCPVRSDQVYDERTDTPRVWHMQKRAKFGKQTRVDAVSDSYHGHGRHGEFGAVVRLHDRQIPLSGLVPQRWLAVCQNCAGEDGAVRRKQGGERLKRLKACAQRGREVRIRLGDEREDGVLRDLLSILVTQRPRKHNARRGRVRDNLQIVAGCEALGIRARRVLRHVQKRISVIHTVSVVVFDDRDTSHRPAVVYYNAVRPGREHVRQTVQVVRFAGRVARRHVRLGRHNQHYRVTVADVVLLVQYGEHADATLGGAGGVGAGAFVVDVNYSWRSL